MMEQILPGVGAVQWAALRSGTRDAADEVPRLLVALASLPDDGDASEIRADLSEHLAPDGLLFQVTPFAVPFLVSVAQDIRRPNVAFIAKLILEDIAYGEPHADELRAGNAGLMRDVGRGLVPLVDFLDGQLASAEPRFRAQAIALLAPIDGGSPRFREMLAGLAAEGDHRLVVEAALEADEYLADIAGGERAPLPIGRDGEAP